MSSFTQLGYHVVFATKFRKTWIKPDKQSRIYQYVGGIVRDFGGSLLEIGGIEDHVHLLVNIPPTLTVSDAVRTIKASSSKWIHEHHVLDSRFTWQKGYAAFTVSYSHRPAVAHYIQTQEQHHKTLSFREEYMELLRRHNISFEERYLFEDEHHG